MHSQTFISMLILAAVLCSVPVESDILTDIQTAGMVVKLNTLVHHPGWRSMDDVKLLKKQRKETADPVSEILEAVSSNRQPVDGSNALERHLDIYSVLMCKYANIILGYKNVVKFLIRFCQDETDPTDPYGSYYDCFDMLLTKIHSTMSPKIQRMFDAVDFLHSMNPQSNQKYLLPGLQKFIDYTSTLRPTTLAKMSERRANAAVIDFEMNAISERIMDVYTKNIYSFTLYRCSVSKKYTRRWTVPALKNGLERAKSGRRIPQNTSMLEYVEKEIDGYVDETMVKWFDDLGFAYGEDGKITIRTNQNIISAEIPIHREG